MSIGTRVRDLLLTATIAASTLSLYAPLAKAGIFVSVNIAPPVLPVYTQPPLPAPGYIWTPGYWAYGDAGYFWVPGVWVLPPRPGILWTPGYWGFAGSVYGWHAGYWGPHVGFYGGVNYGFGYGGVGFVGGEWRGGVFAYNSAVANFGGVHVTNVYENRTIVTQNTIVNGNHASFNGGAGIQARASATEMQAANEHHFEPTPISLNTKTLRRRIVHSWLRKSRPTWNPRGPAISTPIIKWPKASQSQPISAADRTAGRAYQPNTREANQDQRIATGCAAGR